MSDVLELENEIYQDEPEQSTEQVEEEFIAPVLNPVSYTHLTLPTKLPV